MISVSAFEKFQNSLHSLNYVYSNKIFPQKSFFKEIWVMVMKYCVLVLSPTAKYVWYLANTHLEWYRRQGMILRLW